MSNTDNDPLTRRRDESGHSRLADHIIQVLNDLVKADPAAMEALIETRVPCNKVLGEHPVAQTILSDDGGYQIGILGVLNAITGIREDGWGYIAAHWDDDSGKFTGFVRTPARPVACATCGLMHCLNHG